MEIIIFLVGSVAGFAVGYIARGMNGPPNDGRGLNDN